MMTVLKGFGLLLLVGFGMFLAWWITVFIGACFRYVYDHITSAGVFYFREYFDMSRVEYAGISVRWGAVFYIVVALSYSVGRFV